MEKDRIKKIILSAIDEINLQSDGNEKIDKSLDAIIFGKSSNIDSIAFINLIITIEENIEEKFNVSITIANEKAITQRPSPMKNIRSMIGYIEKLLKEQIND